MTKPLKRLRLPDAHIDSTLVVAYATGVALFATWIAYETRDVISPYWLGTSIITLALYQLAIFWVMLQSWEIDRIMATLTINIVSLGLIMNFVSYILNIELPADLPVHSTLVSLAGLEATSTLPGAVALSYTLLAVIVGLVMMGLVGLIENIRGVTNAKKWLRLEEIDLRVDIVFERISGKLEDIPGAWLGVPLGLMGIAMIIVIGGAWTLSW